MMKIKTLTTDSSKPISGEDKYLVEVEQQLNKSLSSLETMLYTFEAKDQINEPVAFATNALYTLEFHQRSNPKYYETILFPIIKSKAEFLHSEGVASSLWALGKLETVDESLVETLVDVAADKKFGKENTYLTHKQYNVDEFSPIKDAHFSERTLSEDVKSLFYHDQIQVVELYDGVQNLLAKPVSSGLTEKLTSLRGAIEQAHPTIRETHSKFLTTATPEINDE